MTHRKMSVLSFGSKISKFGTDSRICIFNGLQKCFEKALIVKQTDE
jgi:hypothetical protein